MLISSQLVFRNQRKLIRYSFSSKYRLNIGNVRCRKYYNVFRIFKVDVYGSEQSLYNDYSVTHNLCRILDNISYKSRVIQNYIKYNLLV